MRYKKLVSLGMMSACLFTGLCRGNSVAGGTLREFIGVGRRNQVKNGIAEYSFIGIPSYENVVVPGEVEQQGKRIELNLGGLQYRQKYFIAFKFGGTPMEMTGGLKIKAVFDNMAGFVHTSDLTVYSRTTAKTVDSDGYLRFFYHKDSDSYVIEYDTPHSMGGWVNIVLDVGTDAHLSQVCAYSGTEYQGFIHYRGKAAEEDALYPVVDNKVTIQANPADPLEPSEILAGIVAYDEYDDEWYRPEPADDSLEEYAAAFSEGFKVGDKYIINLKACDKSGNESFIEVTILFRDTTAPTIEVEGLVSGVLRISYDDARSEEYLETALKQYVKVTDDSDYSIAPEIQAMDFVPLTLGVYDVHIIADDGYNVSTLDIKVEIYDDVAPTISGPSVLVTATSAPLTEEGIIQAYAAEDEIDGSDVKVSVVDDEYHEGDNATVIGEYSVTLAAVDDSGNRAEKEIVVRVEDQDAPTWHVYGSQLTVIEDSSLAPLDIVANLVAEGTLDDLEYVRAEIISGTVIDGTQEPGEYRMTIKAETADGQTRYANLTVTVVARDAAGIDPAGGKKHSAFVQFFIDLWNSIVDFFKKLFGLN